MTRFCKLLICSALVLCSATTFASRSPFDNATSTLFNEATEFFNAKCYDAAIRYYKDFLDYKPSDIDSQDERVRVARQNIALASYILRRDEAASLLKQYKADFPYTQNAVQIELYLGILDFENGKYKPALKRFETIKTDNLSDSEFNQLLFYRGYCYLQQNKFDKASYEFSQLLKRNENEYTEPTHYYYGYCQFYLGNYKTALEHLLIAKDIDDFRTTTPYLICQCHYHLGNCERATAMGDSILKANPKGKFVNNIKHLMAACQFSEKKYAEALDNMLAYKKSGKKLSREDWYIIGISYFKTDNAQKSIEALKKVTNKDDIITQNSYFHIAMAYLALGDKKNARMSFESASRYKYDKNVSCDALYNYALVTYELSYAPFNESVSAFEKFLKEYPNSPYCDKVYEYLVDVYLTTNNYQAAYKSIQNIDKKNLAVCEAEQRVLFGMGTTAIANRKYADAAESFKKIIAGKPYNQSLTDRSYFWYGECLYRTGNYAGATENFTKYLKTTTNRDEEEYGFAHYNLGYSTLKEGKKSESNIWFRKFVNLANTDRQMLVDAYNRIGDNYFSERQFAQAKQAYKSAIDVADKVAGADYSLYQIAIITGLEKDYNGKIEQLNSLIAKYPKSQYADDALYAIGESYVSLNDNNSAIETFKKVSTSYPATNPLVRQSKLQIATLQYNSGNVNSAITMYKDVITNYPGTEEAATALQTLESVMVDNNRVSEYAAIAKKVNKGTGVTVKEDSLTYKAAEKIYFRDEFRQASSAFEKYLEKYKNGKYATLAKYYNANCYYRLGDTDKSLAQYTAISDADDNPNKQLTYARIASMLYDKKEYNDAMKYYIELSKVGDKDGVSAAKLGIMRSAYNLKAYTATVQAASDVIADNKDSEILAEAKYKRMKSNIALGNRAMADIRELCTDTRTEYGAEAEYLLIQNYYDTKNYEACEKEFFQFVDKGTPHSYFLAKAFIVLADCYIAQEKYFDAKQYLLSLKENYSPAPQDITENINSRLSIIESKENIQNQPEETNQETQTAE